MPKSTSDELFRLIHSLNKAEKTYFNSYTHAFSIDKKNQLLKLFTVVNLQKYHDDEKVISHFQTLSKNHLSSLKSRLQQQILKCLNHYYSDADIEAQLQELIRSIKILHEKKLLDTAAKLLTKAKKIALDYECYEYLLIISFLESKILYSEIDFKKFEKYLDKESGMQTKYLDHLKNIVDYQTLYNQIVPIISINSNKIISQNIDTINRIIQDSLLVSPKNATSILSLNTYYNISHYCSYLLNHKSENINAREKEWIEYLEKDRSKLAERKFFYLHALSRIIKILIVLKKFKEMEYFFNKGVLFIESLPGKAKTKRLLSSLVFITTHYIGAQTELHQAEKALQAWEKLKSMSAHKVLSQQSSIALQANVLYAHFVLQQYHEALYYANKIVNFKNENRLDVQQYIRMFTLIIHYELNNIDILPNQTKSVRGYLSKNNATISEHDKCLLIYFERKLPKISGKQEEKDVFAKWKQELLQLPIKSVIHQEYFDLFSWLDSKIENRTFTEIVKKKAKLIES